MSKTVSIAGRPLASLFPDEEERKRVEAATNEMRDILAPAKKRCAAILWGEKGWTYNKEEETNLLIIGTSRKNISDNVMNILLTLSNKYAGSLVYLNLEQFFLTTIHKNSLINHILDCPNVVVDCEFFTPKRYLLLQKFQAFTFPTEYRWNSVSKAKSLTSDEEAKIAKFNNILRLKAYKDFDEALGETWNSEITTIDTKGKTLFSSLGRKDRTSGRIIFPVYLIKDMGSKEPAKLYAPKTVYVEHNGLLHFALGETDDETIIKD